jgi:hypothetical protein
MAKCNDTRCSHDNAFICASNRGIKIGYACSCPCHKQTEGYWCVVCERFLPKEDGVVVHDAIPHPEWMTFDEESRPQ